MKIKLTSATRRGSHKVQSIQTGSTLGSAHVQGVYKPVETKKKKEKSSMIINNGDGKF